MPNPLRSQTRLVLLLLPLLGTLSCATYNDRTREAMGAFRRGELDQAGELFRETAGGEFLAGVEAGMVALAAGDWGLARGCFLAAAREVQALEDRGLGDPRAVAEETLEWTLVPTSGAYEGEGYERVLLHVCLGLVYLSQGLVEDVLVECKRADRLLTSEQELYEKEYGAGGMGHLLSAITYELQGRLDEAYIDYKRLHEKGLAPELVGPPLVRLSGYLGRSDEQPRWVERYGPVEPLPPDSAQVIVIAGVGLGPYKEESRIDVPLPDGFFSAAVPEAMARPQPVSEVVLHCGGASVHSVVVEDVARVLRENVADRIGLLALQSTLRGTLKYIATTELTDEYGTFGLLVGSLATIATERADLRCWTTLPDTWQVARLHIQPGLQRLQLEAPGGGAADLGTYILHPGETMFVLARTVGTRLYSHPIGGQPADPEILSELGSSTGAPLPGP